jgi:hypothetical protein
VGEATRAVLTGLLGYPDEQVEALRRSNAIEVPEEP